MPCLDYQQAVRQLYDLQRFGVKLGLEKIKSLLGCLGNPQDTFLSCHIAGTNGKGTVAAVCDALLRAHGVQSGLYTSPHLVSLRERIRVCGGLIPEEFVASWVGIHREYLLGQRVTFFEAVTALAFDYFRSQRIEAAAVEVGLGGRFDATNVVSSRLGVITSIGLEHTRYLGKTLAAIAKEKAGIMKPGVPLLCGERRKKVLEVIGSAAGALGCPFLLLDEEVSLKELSFGPDGTCFNYRGPGLELVGARVRLFGVHQLRNVALGIRAAEFMLAELGVKPQGVLSTEALAEFHWPARFQIVPLEPNLELVLDVAHNPPAAAKLAGVYRRLYSSRKALAVVALATDKDYRNFLRHLGKIADRFIFPLVDFGRTDSRCGCEDPRKLQLYVEENLPQAESYLAPQMQSALELAARLSAGRPVLLTGSFHTVGEAMRIIGIEA